MVYIASIEDQHALIFKGPVTYAGSNPQIITRSDLNDAKELWHYLDLPKKEAEWPAIRRNAEDALQHIEAHLDPPIAGRRILDFGSGWGFFLAAAKEHGCLTHGLDPIPACGIYARAKFQLDIITDTLHRDTYPPDFFDAITSFQVFLAKLEVFGVTRFDPLGEPFDHTRHEAVTAVPTAEPPQDGLVVGVLAPGYLVGDEVLRPARVAVEHLARE